VQAIRGLPLFCKDTPENIGKMVDILVQILGSGKLGSLKVFAVENIAMIDSDMFFSSFILVEEFVERDAVHKALMSLLRQDVKGTVIYLYPVRKPICSLVTRKSHFPVQQT